jgi:hypothetical protein
MMKRLMLLAAVALTITANAAPVRELPFPPCYPCIGQ